MNEVMYQNYASFKAELDKELMQEAAGFVKIGYLLRVAQDTNILSESQYDNVNDFAKAEYGLDKSQVSRFMAINERFSQGGYSDQLEDQFKSFGVAKLSIMLQLPDAVNEQLSPDMTKSEINAIKDEVKEEEKISDIEVMLEEKHEGTLLSQIINNILEEHPDIFSQIWDENKKAQNFGIVTDSSDYADDVLASAGEAVYTTRVSGVGKVMLTIKAGEKRLIITNIRTGEITEPAWEELGECLRFKAATDSAKTAYEMRFDKEFPKEEEPKPAKAPSKVITTPKKETPKVPQSRISTEYGGDSEGKSEKEEKSAENEGQKVAETRISTEYEANSENGKNEVEKSAMNEPILEESEEKASESSKNDSSEMPQSRISTEYDTDLSTKSAAGTENGEVAPVQQPENVINTECEADSEKPTNPLYNKELYGMMDKFRDTLLETISEGTHRQWLRVKTLLGEAGKMLEDIMNKEDELKDMGDEPEDEEDEEI